MGKSKELATLTDATSIDIAGDLAVGGLTVGTDKLAVDASGRVTMPYQPAFHSYMFLTNNWTGNAGDVVPFDTAEFNIGGHFNTSTYRFTAPVTGRYLFYVKLTSYTWWGDYGFYVNGGQKREVEKRDTSQNNWTPSLDVTLFNLSADDYVDIRVQYNGGGSYMTDGNSELWESFGGHLVG